MSRLRRHIVASLVAALLLVSCGSFGGNPPEETPSKTGNLTWVKYTATGAGGDGAEVTGVIVNRDGCLGIDVDGDEGSDSTLLAFSSDDERPLSLREGDAFSGAGGEIPAPGGDDFEYPESCADAETIIVIAPEE